MSGSRRFYLVILFACCAALIPFLIPKDQTPKRHGTAREVLQRLAGFLTDDLAVAARTPMGEDGRLPVYQILLGLGFHEQAVAAECTTRFSGGPSPEQVLADEYTAFPFVRALGRLNEFRSVRPILWEAEPQDEKEGRWVAFSNATVRHIADREFRALMAR